MLHKLSADRLLHVFRVNAGLPSSAKPLGGWEKPDCEVRGHFPGHFLSACSLTYSSTGDIALKDKADGMVAELAKCQKALGGSYLSAFPSPSSGPPEGAEAGLGAFLHHSQDHGRPARRNQQLGNQQALEVVEGMAELGRRLDRELTEPHMQDVLNTEFGGMNEVLYNLSAMTGNKQYAEVAHRFDHRRIIDPLAVDRDELKGLHANTNVPKIIGSARRYELTGEPGRATSREFFWHDVTSARTYCTGGTSQDEHWKTDPLKLAEELAMDCTPTSAASRTT